jgi:nicotinamidase-related amidase
LTPDVWRWRLLLRTLAGMNSSIFTSTQQALIVIDVQQSFTRRPYYSEDGKAAYLAAQNELIAQATQRGVPVIRVFHESLEEDAADPFTRASGYLRPLDGLMDFSAARTVYKHRHSALVGSGLDVWLTENGVQEIIISGIRTEQCCETTTRHASDLGWQVCYVPEATWTWPMKTPSGAMLSADDLRDRTQTVLEGRFARFASL